MNLIPIWAEYSHPVLALIWLYCGDQANLNIYFSLVRNAICNLIVSSTLVHSAPLKVAKSSRHLWAIILLGLSGAPRACSFWSFLLLGFCLLHSPGCPSPSPLSQSSQQALLPSTHPLPGVVPLGSILCCLIRRCSHSTELSLDELILSMASYLRMIFISVFTLLNSDAYINFRLDFHSLSNYSYQALS